MKTIAKTIFVVLAALVLGIASASLVSAYESVNHVGSIYQYTATGEYSYSYDTGNTAYYDAFAGDRFAYGYIAPPRTGGFYGGDRSHLIGLRPGVYRPFGPVAHSVYAQPTCPWPYCHLGAAGYPRPTFGDIRIRSRIGGIFGY